MTRHNSNTEAMATTADKTAACDESGPVSASPAASTSSGGAAVGRKQLPSVPDTATQQSLAKKMGDKTPTSPRGNHTYGPFFLEYSLLAEYNQIQKQKLPGVYVIPSTKSALFWHGVLFIRQGLYQGGIFRFSLFIPENYPDGDCPRLVFDPPVFHPIVDSETGELDVKRGFQKWRKNVNHIWQVLLYARRVFYKIDTKCPLNQEAASLYEGDLELFKGKVAKVVEDCEARLYDSPPTDDPHAIRFSRWDEEMHGEARSKMLQPKRQSPGDDGSKNAQSSGLSWMRSSPPHIFSRDDSASA